MAGLPLALAQAGSFMSKYKKSFVAYLNLHTKMGNSTDVQRLLARVQESGLEDPLQQSILTTWKISMD